MPEIQEIRGIRTRSEIQELQESEPWSQVQELQELEAGLKSRAWDKLLKATVVSFEEPGARWFAFRVDGKGGVF